MVGQVLMKGRYSYYRCRGSYVGRSESNCESKYIRTASLESRVRSALLDVLSDPERILDEVSRLASVNSGNSELSNVMEALKAIEGKQRRLVRLFTDGDLPQEMLELERTELSSRRLSLETERGRLEQSAAPALDYAEVKKSLPTVVRKIREWILASEGEDLGLLLNAVDAHIVASSTEARISGALPAFESGVAHDLATTGRTSA